MRIMTVVRVANCAGWLWDRFSGLRDALAGPVDVVTGDYLAEPTLRQLALEKQRDPALGYAQSFLAQFTRHGPPSPRVGGGAARM